MIDTIFTYIIGFLLGLFVLTAFIGLIIVVINRIRFKKFSKKYGLPYWVVNSLSDSLRLKGYEQTKYVKKACELSQVYAFNNQISYDDWNDDYIDIIIELFILNHNN